MPSRTGSPPRHLDLPSHPTALADMAGCGCMAWIVQYRKEKPDKDLRTTAKHRGSKLFFGL